MKKILIYAAIAGLLIFGVLLFQPLPNASAENCVSRRGAVISVSGGGSGDIVIRLKDDKHYYYINRGIESGLTITDLQRTLLEKQVELLTITPSNPFTRGSIGSHIAQLKYGERVIYSEL